LWEKINNITVESYEKSLELDEEFEPHLTLEMLETIFNLGSSELSIKTGLRLVEEIKRDQELAYKMDEIEVVGKINVHLIRLGRYDQARELHAYLQEKYTTGYNPKLLNKQAEKMEERISKHQSEKATKVEETESPKTIATQEQETPQQPQEAVEASPPIQTEKPDSQFKPEYIYILIAAFVLLAIGAGVWLRSRK